MCVCVCAPQAGREVGQLLHRAERTPALCHPEGRREEGADGGVRTGRPHRRGNRMKQKPGDGLLFSQRRL